MPERKRPGERRGFLFMGTYYLTSGRGFAYFDCGPFDKIEVPEHVPLLSSCRVFQKPLFKYGAVGCIYEIQSTPTGAVPCVRPAKLGEVAKNLRVQMEVREAGDVGAHRAELEAKKEGERDLSVELLEPWRRVYHNSSREVRAAIVARIVGYLESGKLF